MMQTREGRAAATTQTGDRATLVAEEGEGRASAATKAYEDLPSTINSDMLLVLRKRHHFPKDLIVQIPERFDRIQCPPRGYISCSEKILRAGFRFPIAPEVLELLQQCDVAISQFSYRSLTVIMGLVVFFREKGKCLNASHLGAMCKFYSDHAGHVGFREVKDCVHFTVSPPATTWSNRFFYVKNEWRLQETWVDFRGFRGSKNVSIDEILKVVGTPSLEALRRELLYIHKFVLEDRLFNARMSHQAGRSHALPLKRPHPDSTKFLPAPVLPSERRISDASELSLGRISVDHVPLAKRMREDEMPGAVAPTGKDRARSSSVSKATRLPFQVHIPEDILKRSSTGHHDTKELVKSLDARLDAWNSEYVRIKYMQGDFERKLVDEVKRSDSLEVNLAECRAEMSNLMTTISVKQLEIDRLDGRLVDARAHILFQEKTISGLTSEKKSYDEEKERLQKSIAEKESALAKGPSEVVISKAIEDFKASRSCGEMIDDHLQEVRDHIINVEMREEVRQNYEEGFTRGFLKAVRLVHRRTGVDTSGIEENEVSDDDEEPESVLKDILLSDEDVVDVVD